MGVNRSNIFRFVSEDISASMQGLDIVRSSNPTPVRLCKAEVFLVGAGMIGTQSHSQKTASGNFAAESITVLERSFT